ncbi:MAG: hypothetical protein J6Q68_01615 [Clostridia bacterium]|nr:hypothetical protein [Clostridia bacterium]
MICEKCGQQIADNSTTCPYCQAAVTPIETVNGEVVAEPAKLSGLGIASICCGAGSFLIGGIPAAVVAIVLAILEKNKNPKCGKKWMIGLILGIASAALCVVSIALIVLIYIIAIAATLM